MDTLLHYFTAFNAYAKGNPLIAGAIGLWGLGIVTFVFLKIPLHLWKFIKRQCTTTLTFTNDTTGNNLYTYRGFMEWFEKHAITSLSRSVAITPGPGDSVVGIGAGTHYFMMKGRLFWLTRTQLQTQGTYQIFYQIDIATLGRNRQRVIDLVNAFIYRSPEGSVGVYGYEFLNWARVADTERRALESVAINKNIRCEILDQINEFKSSRTWYMERGIPYKLAYVLHGKTGTGKTSFIRALAGYFNMSLCVIDASSFTDAVFDRMLRSAPDNSIILIEDFDSNNATKARKKKDSSAPLTKIGEPANAANNGPQTIELDIMGGFSTLAGLLNAIDGPIPLHNKIIFMTTNVLKDIDEALVRKGRIDHIYELGDLTAVEIADYMRFAYPDKKYNIPRELPPITGADLQALHMKHRTDPCALLSELVDRLYTYHEKSHDAPKLDFVDTWTAGSGRT